jgi:hypothetical protein
MISIGPDMGFFLKKIRLIVSGSKKNTVKAKARYGKIPI